MHRNLSAAKKTKTASYIELRSLALVLVMGLMIVSAPLILRAIDSNGDNLDDTWEAQYGITTNAYAATNLVGWWQMEGTNAANPVIDRSTNGVTGTPANTTYGAGLFGSALYFSTNGSVAFPATNSVLNTTNGFTFSSWFRGTNSTALPATVATWSDSTNSWQLGADTNGAPMMVFETAAGDQVVEPVTPPNLYDGEWHQLAGTYTTNQVATVYMDGTNVASANISGWTPGPVASFVMGSTATNAPINPFVLDEARMYDRTLGPSEITQLPVTYYDLNGTGLSVYDDYLIGLSPTATNEIVTSSFLGSGLLGYYGTGVPTITKTGGDEQAVATSAFESNPLVVHVTNSSGTALVGAPITFAIASGSDGGLSLTSGGTTGISVSMVTDSSGNATVYYQSGPDTCQNNFITATAATLAGNVSVTFVAYCGLSNNLAFWIRADAGVTTSGSAVTALADQTGHYTLTQGTTSIAPTLISNDFNGRPGLHFSGNQIMSSSASLGTAFNADMTIITVGSATTSGTAIYLGAGDVQHDSGITRAFEYNGAKEVLDCNGASCSGAAAIETGTLVVEAVTLDSSLTHVTFYQNGTQVSTGTITGLHNITQPGINFGAQSGRSLAWTGDIAEQLIFSHQLTTAQLNQVWGYLSDRYGLYSPYATWPMNYTSAVQYEITRNHWSQAQANQYVAMQAANPTMLTNGLLVWLRADAGVTVSSGKVASIVDQAGTCTLTPNYNSTEAPTYVANDLNGYPGLRFNGDALVNTSASFASGLSSDMTILTVGMTTSPSTQQTAIYFGNTTAYANRAYYYKSGNQYLDGNGGGCAGGPAPSANTFVTEAAMINSSLNQVTFYQNGSLTATSTAPGTLTTPTAGIEMGGTPDAFYVNYGWSGDIVEQLVYDHKLSPTEFQQAEGYLATKYGLYSPNATWPLAYSASVQATIARHHWNQAQANQYVAMQAANPTVMTTGLSIWYRADAGVTQSTNSVSAVADQVGGYPLTQSTTTYKPTYVASDVNGLPGLRFTGTQYLSNTNSATPFGPGLNADITVVSVGSSTLPNHASYALGLGQNGNNTSGPNRNFGYTYNNATGRLSERLDGGGQTSSPVGVNGIAGPTANSPTIEVGELNSTLTQETYCQNGNLSWASTVSGTFTPVPYGVMLGGVPYYNASTYGWSGDLLEEMVYDHQLSTNELAQVLSYLATKYGISVASPPLITPNGGNFSTSQTVTITTKSGAVTRYTLDGTTPTAQSPAYTSSLTITQSCPIATAYFINGVISSSVNTVQFYVGDSDQTGISDAWQMEFFGYVGVSPNALAPSGLTYLQDYLWGYSPLLFSTNGDGLSDIVNHQCGYAGTDTDINGAVDSNSNPLTNAQQLALGLDPFEPPTTPAAPGEPAGTPGDNTPPTITLTKPNNATLLP